MKTKQLSNLLFILTVVSILNINCKNKPPYCDINQPTDGQKFLPTDIVLWDADVYDKNKKDNLVTEFYLNDVKMDTIEFYNSSQYRGYFEGLKIGNYKLKVVATDSKGEVSSDEVSFIVDPQISSCLSGLVDGVQFSSPCSIVLIIHDGNQLKIEGQSYNNDVLGFDLNNTNVGEYIIDSTDTNIGYFRSYSLDNSWNTAYFGSGKITVTNKTSSHITGTFYFTAKSDIDETTVNVTEGKFDVDL